jgi:hypothetical protein
MRQKQVKLADSTFSHHVFTTYPNWVMLSGYRSGAGCKGNLAVLRPLKSSKGGSKEYIRKLQYMKVWNTTDLAREDPKRIP